MASPGIPVLHDVEPSVLYHGEVNESGRIAPRFDDGFGLDSGDEVRCRTRSPGSASASAGTR
ncbi:hypothetical protein [Natronococcus sp.]|uniref:hypothetical protein n=1 Tax=Natronococcus sp. TaxID=35747 RepID=UPI003A4DF17B